MRDVVSVPAKVANAVGNVGRGLDVPSVLENGTYLNEVCRRVEALVERSSKQYMRGEFVPLDWKNCPLNRKPPIQIGRVL